MSLSTVSSTVALSAYRKGTLAWFPEAHDAWITATLVEDPPAAGAQGKVAKLKWEDEKGKTFETTFDPSRTTEDYGLPPLRNPPLLEAKEDLTNLSYLNEPSVLHSIRTRYGLYRKIYTYSGIVLVAVNPFADVGVYGPSFVQLYAGRRKEDNDPHLFAIAEEAYRCMLRDGKDQTIVVSGESGAGKTVSAKYIMRYFATVDDPDRPGKRKTGKDSNGMSEVEQQILSTNPIMEAFGNAKTTRNNNSSRFGKYLEILFDDSNTIIGARMRTYLLERSRLIYQPDTERNYHIFYQLLAGAPSSERRALSLDDPSRFHYLNQGGPDSTTIPGVDDAEEFKLTQKALSTVGITIESQWHVFKLLAALLHLGNVKITQARNDAMIDEDDPSLILACKLLGLESKRAEFRKWIIRKQIVARTETVVTNLTAAQATVVRDSVAKFVYACIFEWLVAVINESLLGEGVESRVKNFIGVLDIYGFEHFKKNSFEQFCINYANEKLQQEFNAHVFKLEQNEYVAEKIKWSFIDFTDNQPCIDLIENKLGILSLLDEESRLPSGNDNSFAQKLYTQLAKPEFANVFKKPRFGTTAFTVAHYALDVTYEVEGFLEKNKDTVPDEFLALLHGTENRFLKEVMDRALAQKADATPSPNPGAAPTDKRASVVPAMGTLKRGQGAPKRPTLGSTFKQSLISLMDTIDNTNAHYIRCIKPNEAKAAWEIDPQMVLAQLRACGVLETIRISCAGYPTRQAFEEFVQRYYMLVDSSKWGPDLHDLSSAILANNIKEEDKYQVGLTKIFLRAGMLAEFEKLRGDRLGHLATVIQKNWRRYAAVKRYKALQKSVKGIQTAWRRVVAGKELLRRKREKAAVRVQTATRAWLQRKKYLAARKTIVWIQSMTRAVHVRRTFRQTRIESAATLLQSLLRGRHARNSFLRDRKRVVLLQSCVRRHHAKKELKQLKHEARSAIHYKEVSYKLENKVVELTQSLQKRTADNREFAARIAKLDEQLNSFRSKYDDLEVKYKDLQTELAKPTVAKDVHDELGAAKKDAEARVEDLIKRIAEKDDQIQKITDDYNKQIEDLEKRQKALAPVQSNGVSPEDGATIAAMRAEISSLREQLARAMQATQAPKPQRPDGPPVFHMNTGRPLENGGVGVTGAAAALAGAGAMPKRGRPRSITSDPVPEYSEYAHDRHENFRPATVAFPQGTGVGLSSMSGDPEDFVDQIMHLLGDERSLEDDVLEGIIKSRKLPTPSIQNPPSTKEVLFPAHLISLVTNEMWKYGMMVESERFLANVMQTIQQHVMSFQGEDAILPGIFWLSNVHEILSFVCVAESDMNNGIRPGEDDIGREFDWDVYERLVYVVKHDLDSLEYNIYHTWMQETKKTLQKMIIPALVESQALPGFVTQDGAGRLFNRFLPGNSAPAYSMDDILNLLNKVWKALRSFYVEQSVVQQVVTELLKLIGVTSFNDILMRRNFCSWKRAMQIQYNITRIEEWCKSHDMPEGTLQLEHLMQATKLLQLKKATMADIEICVDVCWMLSPSQIQKLITNYSVADYENPISPEILRAVAARVSGNDKNDHLLLPPEVEEAGPYEVPLPREMTGLETYIPAWLNVPHLRRLATAVSQ